jgi:hypothetical protein
MTEETYRLAAFALAILTCALMLGIAFYPAIMRRPDWRSEAAKNHPMTIIGIPVAGCSSFVVITFFGAVAGPIKLSLWGVQIEGAGGPVLLWIICLLGLAFAARMTWNLKP